MSPIPIDYSDGDIELYPYFDDEFDEWGNRIDWIDGFQYVDVDKVIEKERNFDRHLKSLSSKNQRTKKQEEQKEKRYTFVHDGYDITEDGRMKQRIKRVLIEG